MLRRILRHELKTEYQLVVTICEIRSLKQTLLLENLQNRYLKAITRIMKILRVLHPGKNMEIIWKTLFSRNMQAEANVVELLDNILDRNTRRTLLPLLEEKEEKTLVAKGDELFPLLHMDALGWLQKLLVSDHEWTIVCALQAANEIGDVQFTPTIKLHLKHSSPLVRETAIFCLSRILNSSQFLEAVNFLKNEPNSRVRKVAGFLVSQTAS